jgi:hypothetical protein
MWQLAAAIATSCSATPHVPEASRGSRTNVRQIAPRRASVSFTALAHPELPALYRELEASPVFGQGGAQTLGKAMEGPRTRKARWFWEPTGRFATIDPE